MANYISQLFMQGSCWKALAGEVSPGVQGKEWKVQTVHYCLLLIHIVKRAIPSYIVSIHMLGWG